LGAITFDVWHTLVQLPPEVEDRYLLLQEATLAEIVGRSAPIAGHDLGAVLLEPQAAAHAAFERAAGRPGRGSPVVDLATVAARLAGRVPAPDDWIGAIEGLVEAQPFEAVLGARNQLERLEEEGYRTAVVSNLVGETGRSMRRILERLGLAGSIESWAFSEELPWAKPAPEIYWKALEPLSTVPSDAVHIGDLAADIYGARAAGFRGAVLFEGAREYGPLYARLCRANDTIDPPTEHRLGSWEELPALLRTLFSEPR
jgi:FMN phosphatase YigB (HAD superfamily)